MNPMNPSNTQALYRGMDAATLDRQYNARASVASFEQEHQAYVRESERVMQAHPGRLSVVYDERSGERLDLYGIAQYRAIDGSGYMVFGKFCRAAHINDGVVSRGKKRFWWNQAVCVHDHQSDSRQWQAGQWRIGAGIFQGGWLL